MKTLLLLPVFAVNCASAAVAPPKSDAQYAGTIAKVYAHFKTPGEMLDAVKGYTPTSEQKQLLEDAVGLKLPQVKAIGPLLQFNFSGRVENLKVIDGSRNIFEFHGVEIDLSPSRALGDRLRQIGELRGNEKTANLWTWLFPSAYAGGANSPDDVNLATAGVISQAYSDEDKYENAERAAFKLKMICEELTHDPKSKLLSLVPSELADDVIQQSYAKKPKYKRDVSDWQGPVRAYLDKVKPKYCTGAWNDWFYKYNYFAGNQVENREGACDTINAAIACYQKLETKSGVTLFPPQAKYVADLTRTIEPDGGAAAAKALASTVGVTH